MTLNEMSLELLSLTEQENRQRDIEEILRRRAVSIAVPSRFRDARHPGALWISHRLIALGERLHAWSAPGTGSLHVH